MHPCVYLCAHIVVCVCVCVRMFVGRGAFLMKEILIIRVRQDEEWKLGKLGEEQPHSDWPQVSQPG